MKLHGAGKSSADMVDLDLVFRKLALPPKTRWVDIGCGAGDYTIEAARHIGPEGRLFAMDLWEEGLQKLAARARENNFRNITTVTGSMTRPFPWDNGGFDICMMATVLHDLHYRGEEGICLPEVARILRKKGILAVIEFTKIDAPKGPPANLRISEKEMPGIVEPFGFQLEKQVETGQQTYLTVFRKETAAM